VARRLTRNARRCLRCGEVVESRHVHDYRVCRCCATMVDGGLCYARWGFKPNDSEPLYEWEDDDETAPAL